MVINSTITTFAYIKRTGPTRFKRVVLIRPPQKVDIEVFQTILRQWWKSLGVVWLIILLLGLLFASLTRREVRITASDCRMDFLFLRRGAVGRHPSQRIGTVRPVVDRVSSGRILGGREHERRTFQSIALFGREFCHGLVPLHPVGSSLGGRLGFRSHDGFGMVHLLAQFARHLFLLNWRSRRQGRNPRRLGPGF